MARRQIGSDVRAGAQHAIVFLLLSWAREPRSPLDLEAPSWLLGAGDFEHGVPLVSDLNSPGVQGKLKYTGITLQMQCMRTEALQYVAVTHLAPPVGIIKSEKNWRFESMHLRSTSLVIFV
jgi:hypothetical protein